MNTALYRSGGGPCRNTSRSNKSRGPMQEHCSIGAVAPCGNVSTGDQRAGTQEHQPIGERTPQLHCLIGAGVPGTSLYRGRVPGTSLYRGRVPGTSLYG